MLEGALIEAIICDRQEAVKELLDKGALVAPERPNYLQPLLVAARYNRPQIIALLITRGAPTDVRDNAGNTALHEAAHRGHVEATHALLHFSHRELNARNQSANAPLHLAVSANHPEIIRLLIAAGTDINIRNDDEETPLHIAAKHGGSIAGDTLMRLHADYFLVDNTQQSPAMLAQKNNHYAVYHAIHHYLGEQRLAAYTFLFSDLPLPLEIRCHILNYLPYMRRPLKITAMSPKPRTMMGGLIEFCQKKNAARTILHYYRMYKARQSHADDCCQHLAALNLS